MYSRLGTSHREKGASCHLIDLRQVQDSLFGAGVYIPALAFGTGVYTPVSASSQMIGFTRLTRLAHAFDARRSML